MIDELIRISKAGIWFSISGMLTVAFIYCIWGLGEDIYSEFKEYKLETAIEEGGKLSGEINHRDKNNQQEEFKDLKVS